MPETQAGICWRPPTGALGDLVLAATHRAGELARDELAFRGRAEAAVPGPSLRAALLRDTVGIIAEVKRSSPSKGAINPGLDAARQAALYTDGGAAAISVLTEPERFGGSSADLASVAAAVAIPVLKKDFHVAVAQLYEARALGASAALLIVRALEPARLHDLIAAARSVGLESLVEIRDERELGIALSAGAEIIGVNNRNLETLVIDPETVSRVVPLIPLSVAAVAESGMSVRSDVERAARRGADAVLIGSAVSVAGDPARAVAEMVGVVATREGRSDDSNTY